MQNSELQSDIVDVDKIIDTLDRLGVTYQMNSKTIYTECPVCGRADKFSILKANGHCICYHGNCEFHKGWFPVFLARKLNISVKDARGQLFKKEDSAYGDYISTVIQDSAPKPQDEDLIVGIPIMWPPTSTVSLDDPTAIDGVNYLMNRGIPVDTANYYGIVYDAFLRRVVYPVVMDGIVFGWQSRAIDKNDPNKMLNNTGFNRDTLIMFYDALKFSNHAIICEGPVDAIKFRDCGGAICTMGKAVSSKQLKMIELCKPDRIYLALDDDAADEMKQLLKRFKTNVFKINVPSSAKVRCRAENKKADFGECTFQECVEAFRGAEEVDKNYLITYLRED